MDYRRMEGFTDRLSHKVIAQQTQSKKPTHEDEKIAFVLFLAGGFVIWKNFRRKNKHDFGNCSLQNRMQLLI